jgi:hypothetical protein
MDAGSAGDVLERREPVREILPFLLCFRRLLFSHFDAP